MFDDALIRGTARLFVACYMGRLCIDAAGRRDASSQRIARWFWTTGCLVFVLHVAVAFHFQHGWSHAAAFEHVRLRTLRETGWDSGVGLYVNYAFGLLWLADTRLWWRRLDWPEKWVPYWTVQASFAFLMLQATAVFGPPFWKPACVVAALLLIALRMTRPHSAHKS